MCIVVPRQCIDLSPLLSARLAQFNFENQVGVLVGVDEFSISLQERDLSSQEIAIADVTQRTIYVMFCNRRTRCNNGVQNADREIETIYLCIRII